MFQQELACTAVFAHNVHESNHAGRVQEGGTGTICFGDITGYVKKVGRDEDGLGQWSWILLGGVAGHNTRVIMAYKLFKNKNINSGTSYQQQRCYFITKKKDLTCPLILFCRNLVKQLRQWRASGDRIALFMDHNEHVIEGKLGKVLADREGLDLHEAFLSHIRASLGMTFFWVLRSMDGLWVSSNLDISNACGMPFGFGVGDHCAFILNIPLESLVGINPIKIVRPASRRLNSLLPECGKAYVASLESNIVQHKLLECLQEAHTGGFPAEETARRVIAIEKEGKTYMRHV
jgi:hypothetical protein